MEEEVDERAQASMPIATFRGTAFSKLPEDLYIPPDALEIFLEAFEGPLDLLLYLIRKNNLEILDIPIAEVTRQYMEYVELMKQVHLELAADYLVMAAMLAEIKSRMLLPRSDQAVAEEEDPRASLIRRLQEYERFKKAAEELDQLPRLGREIVTQAVFVPSTEPALAARPSIPLSELLAAFLDVLKRSELVSTHKVHRELLSVRERMSNILEKVQQKQFVPFQDFFELSEGKLGVVVSFLAILELLKLGLIDIVQTQLYAPIHVKAVLYEET